MTSSDRLDISDCTLIVDNATSRLRQLVTFVATTDDRKWQVNTAIIGQQSESIKTLDLIISIVIRLMILEMGLDLCHLQHYRSYMVTAMLKREAVVRAVLGRVTWIT